MLSNATNQPKTTVELGYMCPRGPPPQKKRDLQYFYEGKIKIKVFRLHKSRTKCFDEN